MAFTVQDFEDLVRVLEENSEWKARLRRSILDDELLQLPALVRQNVEAIDRLTAALEKKSRDVDHLTVTVERLAEELQELRGLMDDMV